MAEHIREAMPRMGGNDRYRDKSDRTSMVKTLCGAGVTDRDIRFTDADRAERHGWSICGDCLVVRHARRVDEEAEAFVAEAELGNYPKERW